jgi:lipoic acid synthetase
MVTESFLAKRNISLVQVERGGDITYHGPGQLVGYPIMDLRSVNWKVVDFVGALEEVMIRTVADWGISAERNPLNRGAWVGMKKIGSVGIAVRRGVSFHGFALNVNTSLKPFEWIHPCGLEGMTVTSMERTIGGKVPPKEVREAAKRHLSGVLRVTMKSVTLEELRRILTPETQPEKPPQRPKPPWLKIRVPAGTTYRDVQDLLKKCELHTVCQEARCPNLGECFSRGTATFLILGDHCTRNCRFCAVAHGPLGPPDPDEPRRVAEAVQNLRLRFVVITSVTRDDLPDGGAGHFAATIREIRQRNPHVRVEVLIPDFKGSEEALITVLRARPDVLNHNVETVPRLYPEVRPGADYQKSLELLKRARNYGAHIPTKSGLMLGLGESEEEVRRVMEDLLSMGCRILTLGQYLQPSKKHLPVVRFIPPEEFERWAAVAKVMGFTEVASGPFVRSSYHAGEIYEALAT